MKNWRSSDGLVGGLIIATVNAVLAGKPHPDGVDALNPDVFSPSYWCDGFWRTGGFGLGRCRLRSCFCTWFRLARGARPTLQKKEGV